MHCGTVGCSDVSLYLGRPSLWMGKTPMASIRQESYSALATCILLVAFSMPSILNMLVLFSIKTRNSTGVTQSGGTNMIFLKNVAATTKNPSGCIHLYCHMLCYFMQLVCLRMFKSSCLEKSKQQDKCVN